MAKHHESALIADLRREYSITRATLASGEMSVSEVAELVDALPNGCTYKREVGGLWAWTNAEYIAVTQEYELRVSNWMNSRDGSKGRNRPKPIDPPKGRYEEQRTKQTKADKFSDKIAAFDAMEAKRRARFEAIEKAKQDDASKES